MPASKIMCQKEEASSSTQASTLDQVRLGSFPNLHLFLEKVKHLAPDCSHPEESVEACWEATAGHFCEGCAFRLRFRPMQVSYGEGCSEALV